MLHDMRTLFEHVVEQYLSTASYLAPTAAIVKFPDFENGVVQLLAGDPADQVRAHCRR